MQDQTHSANIRAAAQLVSILGKQLIDENAVGIIELVKNGYDADATLVDVKLDNLHDPSRTQVIVHDNGAGMTVEDILHKWMVAGYSDKSERKLRMERTEGGRLPLGQMGIGRFATARVGKKLMVTTKTKHGPEVYFEIQWADFEGSRDVSDIEIKVIERSPKFFGPNESGTRLAMVGAPDPWSEQDVQSLHRKLLRMVSPIHGIKNFDVALTCPEYPEYERLVPERIIDNFHFGLKATIAASGQAVLEWSDRTRQDTGTEEVDLWRRNPRGHFALNKRDSPLCGPFTVDLRGWRLRKADLLSVGLRDKKAVEELAGVSVFRDGFRILPYGEFGNDWLELNKRRVNNPTERFSTNQLIGLVHISTESNAELLDQANRLGLQQNAAFVDFRHLVTAAVGCLEERTLGAEVARRKAVREGGVTPSPEAAPVSGRRPDGRADGRPGSFGLRPEVRSGELVASRGTTVVALRAILSQVKSLRTVSGGSASVTASLAKAEALLQDALTAAELEGREPA